MPRLPFGNYERVLIHDNWAAVERFVKASAVDVRKHILERYFLYYFTFAGRDIAMFATGTGSAQTNWLVEILKGYGCRKIAKVGTCSALHGKLKDGDVIIPAQAMIDEGATAWRRTRENHKKGLFNTAKQVKDYVQSHEYAVPDPVFAQELDGALSASLKERPRSDCGTCVWSVDSYDCFDGCPALYGQVDGVDYSMSQFAGSGRAKVVLAGVEMECSSLFSAAQELHISAAAAIVVSRSRNLLLHENAKHIPKSLRGKLRSDVDAAMGKKPPRDEDRIQNVELQCIQEIVRVL